MGAVDRVRKFLDERVAKPVEAAVKGGVTSIIAPRTAGGDEGYYQKVQAAGGSAAYDQIARQNFATNGNQSLNKAASFGTVLPYFIPGAAPILTGIQAGNNVANISGRTGIANDKLGVAREVGLAAVNLIPGASEYAPFKAATAGMRPLAGFATRAATSGIENVARSQASSAISGQGLDLSRDALAEQFLYGAGAHAVFNPRETLAATGQLAKGTAQLSRNTKDFNGLAGATQTFRAEPPTTETSTVKGVPVTRPADLQTINVSEKAAEGMFRKGGPVDSQTIDHTEGGPRVQLTLDSNRKVVSWDADRPDFALQIGRHAENGSHLQSRQGGYVGNSAEGEPVPGPKGKIRSPKEVLGSTGNKMEETLRDNNPSFNVNRLNVSPEAKQRLSETVDSNSETFKKVTGERLTNRQVIQAASETSKVLKKAVGVEKTKEMAATILNTRQQLAEQAQTGTMSKEFLDNLVNLKSVATDTGRILQSLSINADPREVSAMERITAAIMKNGQNADEVLRASIGVDFNDPKQAATFYRQFVAPKASEWLDLLRYNSMLSSPNTHINNIFGNVIQSGIVKPVEKTFAGGIDFLAHGTNDKRTHFAGEGFAYSKEYIKSVAEGAQKFADVMTGKAASANLDTRNVPLAPNGGVAGAVESTLSYTTKLLEASDQFFTTLAKNGELGSIKVKQKHGVKVANPELVAEERAARTLFRGELGDKSDGLVLRAIDSLTNRLESLRQDDNPLVRIPAKFTVPFLKTPINIFKQGIEYSPAGIVTIPGSADKTTQLAKAAIGSAVFAGAATLLGSGRLTWAEPTSEKEKNAFRQAGMQPYAVKVGDHWVGYAKLGPLAFPIAMVAAIDDAQKNKKMDQSTSEQVLSGIAKYGGFLADQTYAKGIGDLIKSAQTESGAAQVIANDVQQLIPYRALLGWMERLQDDTQRKPDAKAGIVEKQVQYMLAQIPFASASVPPRTDQNGAVVHDSNNVLNAFSPLKVTTENPEAKQQYQQIADTRINNAKATYEKGQLQQTGETGGQQASAQLPEGLKQLSNGSYAYRKADGTVATEKDAGKAALGLARDQVESGSKQNVTVGDSYVYRKPDGTVDTVSISKVRQQQADAQYSADVAAAKKNKDFDAFSKAQENEYNRLSSELQQLKVNPFVNGADITKTQKKMDDIAYSVASRTGFKASSGSGSKKVRKITPPKAVSARPSAGSFKIAKAKAPSTLLKKYSVKKPKFAKR